MSFAMRILAAIVALLMPAIASATWHEAKSKHFIIYADLKPDELKQYAARLERFDQAVRYLRGMNDPSLTDAGRLTIYVLRSESAVEKLAQQGAGVSGFYTSRASGSVAFVPRSAGTRWNKWDLDAEQIFFHEYAHHMQLQNASVVIPAWAVEGFAEFFATAQINEDGSVSIGSPPLYRAYGLVNLSGLTIEEMLGGVSGRSISDAERELLYGRGWLLTHYLSFEPTRRGQLTRYIDAIQKGQSAIESAKAAFGDLRKLDRELNSYMNQRKLKYVRIDGKVISPGPVAVRPLSSAEAAIMNVHIRSTRGVNKKTAQGVAADARKMAATYPNEAFVQGVLAEAEFDAGNFAAAEAAADHAMAADPNNVHALIYKGRAEMELAKDNGGANWRDIRGWFSRANRLDTENAEPLLLFYQTYERAGVVPTKNAVEGLLYAVALAPQDDGIRLEAVHQLLIDGRLAEARATFAPLAFHPHAPDRFRQSNAQVMAAIDAGDAKRALSTLEAAMKQPEGEDSQR
jgi:tetratricopeptide (TPR) repeat protein